MILTLAFPMRLMLLLLFGTESIAAALATYSTPCPLLGPDYPAPRNLEHSSSILQVKNNFTQTLSNALHSSMYEQLDNSTSFSLEVYSMVSEEPILTYHFTSSLQATAAVGVHKVDSNTIYRLGSVSKLLTTYIHLINDGFASWNDPITKYIPELASFLQNHSRADNAVDFARFDQISLGALASHLSGLPRDAAPGPASDASLAAFGLPKVPPAPGNFCGNPKIVQFPCTRDDFSSNYLSEHPVTLSFNTPIYANAPFYLLQLALEKITSKTLSTLFEANLVKSLALNSTYYNQPPMTTAGIIPVDGTGAWWDVNLNYDTAAGGYYSSLNDLRQIGRSILSSSLLPPQVQRQWLKPVTFTSNPNQAVGAPWEIVRAPIPRTSYMYTKSGDLPGYSAMLALLPDYNVGFNILAAGKSASAQVRTLANLISTTFVPAIEAEAKAQAAQLYAGTYMDANTNSSMTIAVTTSDPGLTVRSWTIGGQDILNLVSKLVSPNPAQQKAAIHLYPSGLKSENGTIESWRAVFEAFPLKLDNGPFSTNCETWNAPDKLVYGGVAADEFLFVVDSDGKATSVQARIVHLAMAKTNSTKMIRRGFQS